MSQWKSILAIGVLVASAAVAYYVYASGGIAEVTGSMFSSLWYGPDGPPGE